MLQLFIYIYPQAAYVTWVGWYILVYGYIYAKKRYSVTALKLSGLRVTLKVKKRYTVTPCIKNVYVFPDSCVACCPQTGDGWGRMCFYCG